PLRRARILRLVNEDVADAVVELKQNPLRGWLVRGQGGGLFDEIVKIGAAAQSLLALIAVENLTRQPDERNRGFHRTRRGGSFVEFHKSLAGFGEAFSQATELS